jgi:hypothetical protein
MQMETVVKKYSNNGVKRKLYPIKIQKKTKNVIFLAQHCKIFKQTKNNGNKFFKQN